MTFDWSEHVDEWYVREHSTQRNGNEWRNDKLGYRIQYRGHRTSYRWCVVIDDNDNFVLSPKKSRFWDGGHSDVMFEVSKMEHEKKHGNENSIQEVMATIDTHYYDGLGRLAEAVSAVERGHQDGFNEARRQAILGNTDTWNNLYSATFGSYRSQEE